MSRGRPDVARCPANNRYIRADELEQIVLESMEHVFEDDRLLAITADALEERRRTLDSSNFDQRIKRIRQHLDKKSGALDRATTSEFEAETAAERESCSRVKAALAREVEHLQQELEELSSERDRLEMMEKSANTATSRHATLPAALRHATISESKEILAAVIQKISVEPSLQDAVINLRAW